MARAVAGDRGHAKALVMADLCLPEGRETDGLVQRGTVPGAAAGRSGDLGRAAPGAQDSRRGWSVPGSVRMTCGARPGSCQDRIRAAASRRRRAS